jgi:hypothetical protein
LSSASCSLANADIIEACRTIGIYERIQEAQRRQVVSQSYVVEESNESGERGGRCRRTTYEDSFALMKDPEVVSLSCNIGIGLIQDVDWFG